MTDTNTAGLTGPQLVARYNALVEQALACGLTGYRTIQRFTDKESAERRIAALESGIRARKKGLTKERDDASTTANETPESTSEKHMAKKKTKTKKTYLKSAPPKKKRETATNGDGSKTAEVGRMLQLKTGCTMADILEATGWSAVSVPAMARACNLELRKEKVKGKLTRYWGN